MIGHVMYRYLESLGQYELVSSAHKRKLTDETHLVDVRNHEAVTAFLNSVRPDYVINCAGLLIEASDRHIEDAILVNSLFPNMLSRLGTDLKFKLFQISTDCVFSGREGNYSEFSEPDGSSAYARTKALGEISNPKDLTVRTSTVGPDLDPDGVGLLTWFLKQKGNISGFTETYWSGVTSLELAKTVHQLINTKVTGIVNLTSEERISKHDLLCLFQKVWRKTDVQVVRDSDYISDKSLCNTRKDFHPKVNGYEEMLIECRQWMEIHRRTYNHYFSRN